MQELQEINLAINSTSLFLQPFTKYRKGGEVDERLKSVVC